MTYKSEQKYEIYGKELTPIYQAASIKGKAAFLIEILTYSTLQHQEIKEDLFKIDKILCEILEHVEIKELKE